MKLKTIILVTAILLGLAILTSWFGGRPAEVKNQDPLVGKPLLQPEVVRGLTALEVTAQGGAPLRLERNPAGQWIVASDEGLPADLDRLRRLLSPLLEGDVLRFVTARPERKEGLDLDRGHLVLSGEGGATLLDLKVGRTASAGGVYVEPAGEGRVYLLEGNLAVDAAANNWVDRTPLDFKPEDVQSVTISFPDEAQAPPVTLSRASAEADWTASGWLDGATPREADLTRILRNLGSLRTTRQVDRDAPEAIEAEAFMREISVTTFAGATTTLRVGRRPEGVPPADWAGATTPEENPILGEEGQPPAEPETPPAGKPFLELAFANSDAAWSAVADQYAFEIADWTFNQLPANPEAILTPPAPPPAPASPPPGVEAGAAPTADPATAEPPTGDAG